MSTYFPERVIGDKAILLIRNGLTDDDLRNLENESWIPPDLAVAAGLERIDSFEGARRIGREKEGSSGKYSGLYFPNQPPFLNFDRGGRLRLDNPDYIVNANGKAKPKAKYLAPPGQGNFLYFGPNESPESLKRPDLPVMIFEGEKKTLAGYRLPRYRSLQLRPYLAVGISGVNNWEGRNGKEPDASGGTVVTSGPIPDLGHIEWKGRVVLICFDADWRSNPRVRQARQKLAKELRSRGANVRFFDIPEDAGVKGFDEWCASRGPEHVLEHFEGTLEAPTDLPPEYRNEEGWLVHIEQDGSTTRICTALDVVGRTSNTGSTGWGLLLRLADDDRKDHLVNVPSELLANPYGTEIRKLLLDQGLHFEPLPDVPRLFMSFLSHKREGAQRIYTTTRIGWSEDGTQYVLPGETLGPKSPRWIYMPPGGVLTEAHSEVSGTLDQWRDKVSRYCSGNVLLALSVSAALSGMLLRLFGHESGGIHFFGPSSKGKSTLLRIARSVYGYGTGSWNATKNGLEASAERHNDQQCFWTKWASPTRVTCCASFTCSLTRLAEHG